jgi:hypothetical protein
LRDFYWAYEPVADVNTPAGSMNTGYVTSTVSDAAKWTRGENPAITKGPGSPPFMLPSPRFQREPGTNMGTTPMALSRGTMGERKTLSKGTVNLSGGD